MFRRITGMVCFLGMAVTVWGDEKEKDPVREKLFAAKVAYDKEMSQFRAQVDEWFDKREEEARNAGDKKAVDLVKMERKAFEEEGDLPKGVPVALKQKPLMARRALEAAYSEAVKAYTKTKKDDEAAAVEKELENFRKGDIKSVLLGTWRVSVGSYKGDWTFKEDGTVKSTSGVTSGKWTLEVAKGRVLIAWANNGGLDKFDLPLSPRGTTGAQLDRMKMKLDIVKIK
jgi:hypothetical protein